MGIAKGWGRPQSSTEHAIEVSTPKSNSPKDSAEAAQRTERSARHNSESAPALVEQEEDIIEEEEDTFDQSAIEAIVNKVPKKKPRSTKFARRASKFLMSGLNEFSGGAFGVEGEEKKKKSTREWKRKDQGYVEKEEGAFLHRQNPFPPAGRAA